jgi:hypothetical protein
MLQELPQQKASSYQSKLAHRAQAFEIAYLLLRQDLLAPNALNTAQRNFYLGNSPFILDK